MFHLSADEVDALWSQFVTLKPDAPMRSQLATASKRNVRNLYHAKPRSRKDDQGQRSPFYTAYLIASFDPRAFAANHAVRYYSFSSRLRASHSCLSRHALRRPGD
jgi:hypothetical protein